MTGWGVGMLFLAGSHAMSVLVSVQVHSCCWDIGEREAKDTLYEQYEQAPCPELGLVITMAQLAGFW